MIFCCGMIWLHPLLPDSRKSQTYPILHSEKKHLAREREWGKPCPLSGGKRLGAKKDDS
jgi:hypothetical protein